MRNNVMPKEWQIVFAGIAHMWFKLWENRRDLFSFLWISNIEFLPLTWVCFKVYFYYSLIRNTLTLNIIPPYGVRKGKGHVFVRVGTYILWDVRLANTLYF